jgi:membrane carboxypeptidase/penicillin-binding protein
MAVALKGVPEELADIPAGIIPLYINKQTGKQVMKGHPQAMMEYFMLGQEPELERHSAGDPLHPEGQPAEDLPDDIL